MSKARSDPISLRAHLDSRDTGEASAYTFERLETVVAELVDSRRQLQAENANLRRQLSDQGVRLQGLDDRLLESNQRRQDALKRILRGRTSIVIAHRRATVRNADKIVVIDQGRLVEVGRHQDLLRNNGVYARLYAVNYGLTHPGLAAPVDAPITAPAPADND